MGNARIHRCDDIRVSLKEKIQFFNGMNNWFSFLMWFRDRASLRDRWRDCLNATFKFSVVWYCDNTDALIHFKTFIGSEMGLRHEKYKAALVGTKKDENVAWNERRSEYNIQWKIESLHSAHKRTPWRQLSMETLVSELVHCMNTTGNFARTMPNLMPRTIQPLSSAALYYITHFELWHLEVSIAIY